MTRLSSSILIVALISVAPVAGALAQNSTNNPDNMAGATGSQVANPQRPTTAHNPALTTGTLPKEAGASVPPDKNPNVAGATGHTVVPGTSSTVSGDKKKTIGSKTGAHQ